MRDLVGGMIDTRYWFSNIIMMIWIALDSVGIV